MKILFSTIVLDGLPFLPLIYSELRKLPKEIDWEWIVCEGVALPVKCTKWCSQIQPRLSNDGTTEYLDSLRQFDKRVVHLFADAWDGKIAMVNAPLKVKMNRAPDRWLNDEFLLWQMDADELWTAEQIVECWWMFKDEPEKNAAYFWCRYFVGPDKVITTRNCFGNQSAFEWLRVWRLKPGMLFETHEPPVILGLKLNAFSHSETEARGLVFDHLSWCTRDQVAFKASYYSGSRNPNAKHYVCLVDRWEKFQQEKEWPRPLIELFPWVEKYCLVSKI